MKQEPLHRPPTAVFTLWPLKALALFLGCLLLIGAPSAWAVQIPPLLTSPSGPKSAGTLQEVPPPAAVTALQGAYDSYQPQVKILSPKPEETLKQTEIKVKLQVQDLPLFENPDLRLGPHVHLILDNEPYRAIFDLSQPITLKDLAPGTHTLRAFPVRPWHESFKNDGAYAQTTFHVFTPSENNHPDPQQPLLTYSRPKGSYGAEPILLDFYLAGAPLHPVAQSRGEDWRIRVTINDQSFLLDRWQPVYLKGFQPGSNWVKLEFIDEAGNLIANAFNNTVRVIDYQPEGQDGLSRLVRGELTAEELKALVAPDIQLNPNALPAPVVPPAPPAPETTAEPTPEAETTLEDSDPVSAETPLAPDIPTTLSPEPADLEPAPESDPQIPPVQNLLPSGGAELESIDIMRGV
ncbi:MAG: hypothetical protein VKN60_00705 [Cyanobacteriota bacterium]|nr:hypothetical protein [Cyanobacteriota bacterium]